MLMFSKNLSKMAGASRQLLAFARDRGLPSSSWMSLVLRISACLSTPSLFPPRFHAFFIALTSGLPPFGTLSCLLVLALVTSNMISIGFIIWRRTKKLPLLPSHSASYTALDSPWMDLHSAFVCRCLSLLSSRLYRTLLL
ncbi:uncharacterized protein CC84DRAFT_910854 [Paraphaeosphaeria sporulosa]|uniref:Uncharacterized protein n=1 Tax=Paraphaeosphaeria sporulosa TaxID=1460663 RepID=A0A177C526_9PLEO|nr:uncharacterized protein CC84DRAFT_910854 [Paraphaeosphaeria sporulosa]OAG02723.1 hypothetical protein CC84DRAFT_910854 [Paraphaeosphaeria sporulosa]